MTTALANRFFRDTNIQSDKRPWDGFADRSRPKNGVNAALPENIRTFPREYDGMRLGQRNGLDDIVILD